MNDKENFILNIQSMMKEHIEYASQFYSSSLDCMNYLQFQSILDGIIKNLEDWKEQSEMENRIDQANLKAALLVKKVQ